MSDENKPLEWEEPGPTVKLSLWVFRDNDEFDPVAASLDDVRAALEPMGLRVVEAGILEECDLAADKCIAELEKELANAAAELAELRRVGCLYGKPFAFWLEVWETMRRHDVGSAEQLESRLLREAAAVAAEDGDVERLRECARCWRDNVSVPQSEDLHALSRATIIPASELRLLRECARRDLEALANGNVSWPWLDGNRAALRKAVGDE